MNFICIGQYLFMLFVAIDMKLKIVFLTAFLLDHVSERTSSSLNHSIQFPL